MRLVGVREAQAQLSSLVSRSQKERIILTRHGRPVAVLSGVQGMDLEDILLGQDRGFARTIAARRRSSTRLMSLEEVKARLGGTGRGSAKTNGTRNRQPRRRRS